MSTEVIGCVRLVNIVSFGVLLRSWNFTAAFSPHQISSVALLCKSSFTQINNWGRERKVICSYSLANLQNFQSV